MKKKIATFILLVISGLLGQSEDNIIGVVSDKSNGEALIGANVVIDNTTLGAATDSDGRYIISGVSPGKYTLKVSYIGYENLEKVIEFLGDGDLTIDLAMEPEAIQMETYVVTASRRRERVEDAPAAISVISKAQIRRESNANLGDYIKGTKGIDFTQSGIDSYNMTARGFNSSLASRLLTLMDGRMANVPSLRLTAYNVIPVSFDDVEQIEVVLGPASALYGPNAHSGVLNIVTSSPLRSQGTSVSVQGGLLNQTNTDLLKKMNFRTSHKFGNFGFKLSGVALAGQDWVHMNPDEYEGHDPAIIGRPYQTKDGIDQINTEGTPFNQASSGEYVFTEEMLSVVDGSDSSWVGLFWADNIGLNIQRGEPGSPVITQEMIDEASSDGPFYRYVLNDEITLWGVTQEKLGWMYADGIDNDGNGAVDNLIDDNIDDGMEKWFDGIDNDNDGLIDEGDEKGTDWMNRFGSYSGFNAPSGQKQGFGEYMYDSEGNLVFDTNNDGIYGDLLGSDGLDNDNDWQPYRDDYNWERFQDNILVEGQEFLWGDPYEPYEELTGNNVFDYGETYGDSIYVDPGFGVTPFWVYDSTILNDFGLDGIEGTGDYGEGNGVWDGDTYTDRNNNGFWDLYDTLDTDGNGQPSPGEYNVDEWGEGDFHVNYGNLRSQIKDANNDGIDDYPDFNVRNIRANLRLDWEPNSDFQMIFSHGYAWARNINITGIARYLADGWIYKYYQTRTRWKNFFLQTYLNTSYSGDISTPTRNLATGSVIYDRSKKFSAQFQHTIEKDHLLNIGGDFRFVWGLDYFLTLPDTRGTILRDRNGTDMIDNNGNGEAGSPYEFNDKNDNTWYDIGELYNSWSTESDIFGAQGQFGSILDSTGVDSDGNIIYADQVHGAIKDGLDNDGDSDDFEDLNSNGIPDYFDANNNDTFDRGEQEPGVKWLGYYDNCECNRFIVYADGLDNDNDGKVDENIDEGIDEEAEDNRYIVNELGAYYQVNWDLSPKLEFIHATRIDAHDRLTDFVDFNNQEYGSNFSPFNWSLNTSETEGLQVSPKFGLAYKPKENQNFRLTWAKAFNTPSNQALFLDIFVTRVSIFKVYARGAGGGYIFPRDSLGRAKYFAVPDNSMDHSAGTYHSVDSEEEILFYPSTDPRISGFYGRDVINLPELEAETVTSWEFGYKGRLSKTLFGTVDIYTSHYSSFVSPVTFITPIVISKSVLETDYDGDSLINNIDDLVDNNVIVDQDDYDSSFVHWRDYSMIHGVTALDTTPGYTPPVVVGYVNYGEVDMWGIDASLTYMLNLEWALDLTYSHLGMTEFFNPITKGKDPINAPRHKASMKLAYNSRRSPFSASLNARYVDGFNWSSGIYYGVIDPYVIFDLHGGYEISKNLKINITLNNLLNNKHTEIIGGPALGRVALARLTTTF